MISCQHSGNSPRIDANSSPACMPTIENGGITIRGATMLFDKILQQSLMVTNDPYRVRSLDSLQSRHCLEFLQMIQSVALQLSNLFQLQHYFQFLLDNKRMSTCTALKEVL